MKRLVACGCAVLFLTGCYQGDQARLAEYRGVLTAQERAANERAVDPGVNAAGAGSGGFAVIPQRVHPGQRVAVFDAYGDGSLHLLRPETWQEVASAPGPAANDFAFLTIPADLAPGEYVLVITGPGGWGGEAHLQIASEAPLDPATVWETAEIKRRSAAAR